MRAAAVQSGIAKRFSIWRAPKVGGSMITMKNSATTVQASIGLKCTAEMTRAECRSSKWAMIEAMATGHEALDDLPADHAMPGGINERCRDHLRDAGWFVEYRNGLDAMKRHLEEIAERRAG